MLRWRLVLPATVVALGLGLVLTAIGYWEARTIGVAASEQVVRHCVGSLSDDIADLFRRSNRTLFRMENQIGRDAIPLDNAQTILRELYAVRPTSPMSIGCFSPTRLADRSRSVGRRTARKSSG
jgi:hypothetical protein